MSEIVIRHAEPSDLQMLLDLYNYYVVNTHITFDIEPRTLAQRQQWLSQFRPGSRYQCLVAAKGGIPIGWAASVPFKDRSAYDSSVETSIYLAPNESGKGLGKKLYQYLLDALAAEDVHRAFAGIALPNERSVKLHAALGFTHVGTYHEVGKKFDEFWDVAWYQRALGGREIPSNPDDPLL